jgi:bacillithiol biosynthesis cysteine-adding enzyme BshC
MKILKVPFTEIEQFSAMDIAYATQDERVLAFQKYRPELSDFKQVIQDKQSDQTDRTLLCEVLADQYQAYSTDVQSALKQIDRLKRDNTFTIVTAHQPVLFTGPAYLIYKIISAIKLTRQLKERYPEFDFIPVYVSGGEDHDFEEMDHMHLYGKTIKWENDEAGSVGRMHTSSLKPALEQLGEILGDAESAKKIFELFKTTLQHQQLYGRAFADLINGLFGHLDLVVINMDDARLKATMIQVFKDELLTNRSAEFVRDTQDRLENAGLKAQAFARDINLFYLGLGTRARIERDGDHYQVLDSELRFTEEEIVAELEAHPERFSPNVIVRPLYQEKILPNLAYVGGGGELAYWLERKSQFEYFGINFPMLVRRDSCLWIDKGVVKKMNKLDLEISDFFKDEVQQIKDYVAKNAEHEFSLKDEKLQIENIWQAIAGKANIIDPTLKGAVAAEASNQIKNLEKIEDRLRRAEKQKHEIAIGQIKSIREKLYPGGGLQERYTNFLEFYCRQSDSYFDTLLENFDPLDMCLKIIVEE